MSTASVPLPNWINYGLIPILNLIVAFLISGLVVWFIGESPLDALVLLLQGALGSGEGIGFTLYYATSFIFTGLSVAVAIHAGLFNIGSEGQAYVGGLGCALVALALDRYVPWYVTMPWLLFVAILLISSIATYSWSSLRVRRSSRLFVIAGVGLLGAALVTNPWTTLLMISLIYLALIPFSIASYARVKRRRVSASA